MRILFWKILQQNVALEPRTAETMSRIAIEELIIICARIGDMKTSVPNGVPKLAIRNMPDRGYLPRRCKRQRGYPRKRKSVFALSVLYSASIDLIDHRTMTTIEFIRPAMYWTDTMDTYLFCYSASKVDYQKNKSSKKLLSKLPCVDQIFDLMWNNKMLWKYVANLPQNWQISAIDINVADFRNVNSSPHIKKREEKWNNRNK